MIEDVGPGVENHLQTVVVPLEVGDKHLDAAVGRHAADLRDLRRQPGTEGQGGPEHVEERVHQIKMEPARRVGGDDAVEPPRVLVDGALAGGDGNRRHRPPSPPA